MKMKDTINVKKKGKKGFTFVELVVVIAVLAILAAIAIPVITTTINSAKLSAMESDRETLDILLKTAVCEMEGNLHPTVYNNSAVGPGTDIEDVMIENSLGDIEFTRKIGGKNYYMVWNGNSLEISETSSNLITSATTLAMLNRTK